MFFAGYANANTDVAVFQSARQRDNWVNNPSLFDRIPLSDGDVYFLTDGLPFDALRQEADDLDDSIVWLINPVNLN